MIDLQTKLSTLPQFEPITFRRKRICHIGNVAIGGHHPVAVQTMTDTNTQDVSATVKQIGQLVDAGAEMVRITVNNDEAAQAVPYIYEQLRAQNYAVPLIGDFHYNGHELLLNYPEMAQSLDKYRINPGNVGPGNKGDLRFGKIIELACRHQKAVRIGANWGSLDQKLLADMMDANEARAHPLATPQIIKDTLIESALASAQKAEEIGLAPEKIVISCKVSAVPELIDIYQALDRLSNYPLHLGLTEAGRGSRGIVNSTAALAVLLNANIGDTIRISLTPSNYGDRCEEVRVAQQILQALQLRNFSPDIIACPGCGRTTSAAFQELAAKVEMHIQEKMVHWRQQYQGVEALKIAVMGCIVNGPGESKHADIGISLPGTGESPSAPVFIDGKKAVTLRGNNLETQFIELIESYIHKRFGPHS